jgi:hypothetical protein
MSVRPSRSPSEPVLPGGAGVVLRDVAAHDLADSVRLLPWMLLLLDVML